MDREVRSSCTDTLKIAASACMIAATMMVAVEAGSQNGQIPTAPVSAVAPHAGDWAPPRTPWGDPDLQGVYSSSTYTPLERPPELAAKEFFTRDEAAAYAQAQLQALHDQSQDSIHYDDAIWQSEATPRGLSSLRTSLVVDPPDGRIPPLTVEAQQRVAAHAAARRRSPADRPESRLLSERCIVWRHEGPPMLVAAYASMYQIVQSPGYVAILQEMTHNVRVIPLDGRAPLSGAFRQYGGESRGRWEGNTLVVEVANFNDQADFRGAANIRSEALRVVERFTRVDENTILYEFTVDDPHTWTRPWSAEFPLMSTDGLVLEYACHEGNYGLANILSAARAEEAAAAEAAAGQAR
jgi:hypothetical protein